MTVQELIHALTDMPPEREIRTEGCDCWGDAVEVMKSEDGDTPVVLITRSSQDLAEMVLRWRKDHA